jgi:hypothetical protein
MKRQMLSRMSNRVRTLLILLVAVSSLHGQARFNVVPLIEGTFSIDRIFQFSLVNLNPSKNTEGYVRIKIQELGGQPLAEYTSVVFKLSPIEPVFGANIDWLKAVDYGSAKNGNQLKDFGTLGFGRYSVCYTFISSTVKSDVFCTEVNAKPQMPPQLLSPLHTSVINFTNPLLTWLPPTPDLSLNYQYAVKLVELRDNQTCIQALQQNTPIVMERNYEGTNLQVTGANGLALEVGQTYCWQVGAYYKNNLVANTEMWQFKVDNTQTAVAVIADEQPFYFVKENLDSDNLRIKKALKIAFDNHFNAEVLKYAIYCEDNREKITLDQPTITLKSGINQIVLDCKTMKNLKPNLSYVIEIYDENGTKYYCRFTYDNK